MVIGCYYITTIDSVYSDLKDEEIKVYDIQEAIYKHSTTFGFKVSIFIYWNNVKVKTSVGRLLFNEILPEKLRFFNELLKPVP